MAYFLPVYPNWRDTYAVTHEWRTEVREQRSGKEQRDAQRAKPRRYLSYLATAIRGRERDMVRVLAKHRQQEFQFVEWTNPVGVVGGAAGFSGVTLSEVPAGLAAGDYLYLKGLSGAEYVQVLSLAGADITTVEALVYDYDTSAKAFPCSRGFLKARISGNILTAAAQEYKIEADLTPGLSYWRGAGTAGDLYNGKEVFGWTPNWAQPLDIEWTNPVEFSDSVIGRLKAFRPVTAMGHTWRGTFVGRNATETNEIVQFFDRQKGRAREFYVPSFTRDLLPIEDLSGSTLTVAGTDTAEDYADSLLFTRIIVRLSDGTYLLRAITGIATSGGNSVLTVDSPWGSTLALSSIRSVQWFMNARFDQDSLTIEHLTNSVTQFQISFRALEDLAV